MDLAYTNKSVNQTATGQNNGRNLVRDNSGNYHLIFASDGEIFYHKMTAGNTWLTPIRLSTGNGNNNYPSISQSGGRIYVTWQRNASGNNYDIYFAASPNGGTSWTVVETYTYGVNFVNGDSPVFILDEVTSSIDDENREKVMDFLFNNDGITVLSVSHDSAWKKAATKRIEMVLRMKIS